MNATKLARCFLLFFLLIPAASAQIPRTLSYQGILTDTLGNPVPDGQHSVTFRLYATSTGGSPLWSETKNVQVQGGVFSTQLGESPALNLAFDAQYWLSVQLGSQEMTPRMKLSSTAYSLRSAVADSAKIAGSVPNNTVTPAMISPGGASSGQALMFNGTNVIWGAPSGKLTLPYNDSAMAASDQSVFRIRRLTPSGFGTAIRGETVEGSAVVGVTEGVGYGAGVAGVGSSASGSTRGVVGAVASPDGIGVHGIAPDGLGVFGYTSSSVGAGIVGANDAAAGGAYGIWGVSHSTEGYALVGIASATSGLNYGVYGASISTDGIGVSGRTTATSGTTRGVYGESASTAGVGVSGVASASSGLADGVWGTTFSSSGYGIWGKAIAVGGVGVVGQAFSPATQAGHFYGNVQVNGALSKSSGSFKIDHPLDPENKYLYHSFVESPDMMNVYNGNVVLDGNGEARIQLPEWFEALNKDFRYQLTCIGGFAPVYVSSKISSNSFAIAGGTPGLEVSWQVTGIRKDAYAEKNRIPVEELKPQAERGTYLHPDVFGQPESKAVNYERLRASQEQSLPEHRTPPSRPIPPSLLDMDRHRQSIDEYLKSGPQPQKQEGRVPE